MKESFNGPKATCGQCKYFLPLPTNHGIIQAQQSGLFGVLIPKIEQAVNGFNTNGDNRSIHGHKICLSKIEPKERPTKALSSDECRYGLFEPLED